MEGIPLDQYIQTVLGQIVAGIAGAQRAELPDGARINPLPPVSRLLKPIDVQFDVAVRTLKRTGADGGVEVKVVPFFNAGIRADQGNENEATTRLQFSVPVEAPHMRLSREQP